MFTLGEVVLPLGGLSVFSASFSAGSPAESSIPVGCYTAPERRTALSLSQV